MKHKILILSDLHLGEPPTDDRYSLFLRVLDKFLTSDIQELLLMGDIFDILIGNKKFWKKIHPNFFEKLESAQKQGKKLTWIQGNHDFQLSQLLEPYSVEWVEERAVLKRHSKRITVTHGDLADNTNKLHPYWRCFLTSQFLRLIIWLIPESLGEKVIYPFTLKLSRSSRKLSTSKEFEEKGRRIFRTYAEKLSQEDKSDIVILGHSHISDDHQLSNSARYINLGSWFEIPKLGILEIDQLEYSVKVSSVSSWLE